MQRQGLKLEARTCTSTCIQKYIRKPERKCLLHRFKYHFKERNDCCAGYTHASTWSETTNTPNEFCCLCSDRGSFEVLTGSNTSLQIRLNSPCRKQQQIFGQRLISIRIVVLRVLMNGRVVPPAGL